MSRYIQILARQRPFPFDVDENGRTLFSSNYEAFAPGPVADWEAELRKLIVEEGLATIPDPPDTAGDVWIGPAVTLPSGDGPYVQIIDTGGRDPAATHNGSRYERLSVQIIVRAADYEAGRTRALAIWRLLDGQYNATVAV